SVGSFFKIKSQGSPCWNVTVLFSRNHQSVMGYGTKFGSGENNRIPRYIILPQMKDNAQVAVRILQCLEDLVPELFPDRSKTAWLNSQEFLLPEERAVNRAIEERIAEARGFIQAKQKDKELLAEKNAFVRALLVATEDPKLPVEQRLSGVVKSALEFLGF